MCRLNPRGKIDAPSPPSEHSRVKLCCVVVSFVRESRRQNFRHFFVVDLNLMVGGRGGVQRYFHGMLDWVQLTL